MNDELTNYGTSIQSNLFIDENDRSTILHHLKGLLGQKQKLVSRVIYHMISLTWQPEKNIGIGNKSVVTMGNIREEGLIKRVNNKELPNMLQ